MMQMLDHGGIDVVTDRVRTADTDNPRGYFEFEAVKRIKQDATWLPSTRGKALKAFHSCSTICRRANDIELFLCSATLTKCCTHSKRCSSGSTARQYILRQ